MYVCKVRGTRQKILSIKYTEMFWRTPWPVSSTMLHPIYVTETPGHWMALWSTELRIGGGYYKKIIPRENYPATKSKNASRAQKNKIHTISSNNLSSALNIMIEEYENPLGISSL